MNKEQTEMTGQSEGFYGPIGQIPDKVVVKDPASGDDDKTKAKRKRKSPAVPWKKPKDMPKRPLSAYNLFFKDEREKLLNRGKTGVGDDASDAGKKKPSGIGFANLAKTIAAKWNELAPDLRAPYEEIASKEKAKYDEAVAKWRVEQKEKQAKEKAMKKEAEELSAAKAAEAGLFGPNGTEGYSRESDVYPSQWFQSGMEHGGEAGIPPFVDTMHDDSGRSYASSSLSPDSPRRRMRPSPPMHSGTSSLSTNSPSTDPSGYYAHPYYAYHDPHAHGRSRRGYSGRRFDPYAGAAPMNLSNQIMRDSRTGRASSIPQMRGPHLASEMERIQTEVAELRRARTAYYPEGEAGSYPSSYSAGRHSSRSAPAALSGGLAQMHPRSASLPASLAGARGGHSPPPIPSTGTDLEAEDPAYREPKRSRRSRRSPSGDEAVFEASLRSLSENLDDDAISFLTNVRFE